MDQRGLVCKIRWPCMWDYWNYRLRNRRVRVGLGGIGWNHVLLFTAGEPVHLATAAACPLWPLDEIYLHLNSIGCILSILSLHQAWNEQRNEKTQIDKVSLLSHDKTGLQRLQRDSWNKTQLKYLPDTGYPIPFVRRWLLHRGCYLASYHQLNSPP